jgi:hypothetical protein
MAMVVSLVRTVHLYPSAFKIAQNPGLSNPATVSFMQVHSSCRIYRLSEDSEVIMLIECLTSRVLAGTTM